MTNKEQKRTIILISGFKRSGKDFTAQLLKDKLIAKNKTVEVLSFAYPMKRIICDTLSISMEQLDEIKNSAYTLTYSDDEESHYMTNGRKLLQHFGSDAMKPWFGEDVWGMLAEKAISKDIDAEFVLIPDFRFPIEYLYLKECDKYNIVTLRINDDNIVNTDVHSSETSMLEFSFDYTIDNTIKSGSTLNDKLDGVIEWIV